MRNEVQQSSIKTVWRTAWPYLINNPLASDCSGLMICVTWTSRSDCLGLISKWRRSRQRTLLSSYHSVCATFYFCNEVLLLFKYECWFIKPNESCFNGYLIPIYFYRAFHRKHTLAKDQCGYDCF